MSDDAQRELREVQAYFRLPGLGLVEKDLHVVRAIAALAAIDAAPFALVFGGGTALARAHRIIRQPGRGQQVWRCPHDRRHAVHSHAVYSFDAGNAPISCIRTALNHCLCYSVFC